MAERHVIRPDELRGRTTKNAETGRDRQTSRDSGAREGGRKQESNPRPHESDRKGSKNG